jgi:hypothetical protein
MAIHATDAAADRRHSCRANGPCREHIVQCVGQEVPRCGCPGVADSELVVDFSAVTNRSARVQYENFRRSRGIEFVGDLIGRILQDRKFDVVDASKVRDRRERVLLIRINTDELDPLAFVATRKLGQFRPILFGQRAFCAQENDGDRLALLPMAEGVCGPERVLESKAVDPLSDRSRPVRRCCQQYAHHEPRRSGCRHRAPPTKNRIWIEIAV